MASYTLQTSPPPIFTGENYQIWAVKMKTYFKAYDLWEAMDKGLDPPPLPDDPTVAQIRNHNIENAKKYMALSCIQ